MCGLFGFVCDKRFTQQRLLYVLLSEAAETRGKDSWGVVIGRPSGTHYERQVGRVTDQVRLARLVADSCWLMGHTRLATTGDITKANAHPFRYTDRKRKTFVAHNGMVYNHRELEGIDNAEYAVDSQALCYRIATNKPVDDVDGYGAVSWVDNKGAFYVSRMVMGDLVVFTIQDRVSGGLATCYVSDDRLANGGLRISRYLEKSGFKTVAYLTPEEGDVYRIRAGGAKLEERRLDISEGYSDFSSCGVYGTPLGKSYQSGIYAQGYGSGGSRPYRPFGIPSKVFISASDAPEDLYDFGIVGYYLREITGGELSEDSTEEVVWRLRKFGPKIYLLRYTRDVDSTIQYLTSGGNHAYSIWRSDDRVTDLKWLFRDDDIMSVAENGWDVPEDESTFWLDCSDDCNCVVDEDFYPLVTNCVPGASK